MTKEMKEQMAAISTPVVATQEGINDFIAIPEAAGCVFASADPVEVTNVKEFLSGKGISCKDIVCAVTTEELDGEPFESFVYSVCVEEGQEDAACAILDSDYKAEEFLSESIKEERAFHEAEVEQHDTLWTVVILSALTFCLSPLCITVPYLKDPNNKSRVKGLAVALIVLELAALVLLCRWWPFSVIDFLLSVNLMLLIPLFFAGKCISVAHEVGKNKFAVFGMILAIGGTAIFGFYATKTKFTLLNALIHKVPS